MELLEIANDGPDIASTNFWDSSHAQKCIVHFSINAGCIRLLLPDALLPALSDMKTAKYAIVSRGPWPEQGRKDAMEVLFEDNSDSPYCLHTGMEQWDMVPSNKEAGDRWKLAVWTRSGKQLEMKCYYRMVDRIPCMRGL